jgi:hypothetical protein
MNLLTTKFALIVIFIQICISSAFPDEENSMATIMSDETVVSSCSLQIKINPVQPTAVSTAPKAIIEVTLISRDGNPISGGNIGLTSTVGTLQCKSLPGNDTDPRGCFITGDDGKAQIDLINIPFNTPVRVKASYNNGDYTVRATGSVIISKKTVHKK